MFDSSTIKACKAWLALCDNGITLKGSTLEDAVESFRKLVEVAEKYEKLCNSQDFLIATLEERVKCGDAAVSSLTGIIENLRKDIAGMEDEISRLRKLNNNQALIIRNNERF